MCETCKGRHRASRCPNHAAKADPHCDVARLERDQLTCNYKDRETGVECRGKGHLARHHTAEASPAAKGHTWSKGKGAVAASSSSSPGRGKGKGRGRGRGSKGGRGVATRSATEEATEEAEWGEEGGEGDYEAGYEAWPETAAETAGDDAPAAEAAPAQEQAGRAGQTDRSVRFAPIDLEFDEDALVAPSRRGREPVRVAGERVGGHPAGLPVRRTQGGFGPELKPSEGALGPEPGVPASAGGAAGAAGARRRSRSEPVRTVVLPTEQMGTVVMGRGFHCVARCTIGSVSFRVTLDTGSARNLVRSSFAEKLRTNSKTRDAVLGRGRADKPVICTGICSDMNSAVLEHVLNLRCRFDSVPDGRGKPVSCEVEISFSELEGASDCLLIGFPTLVKWGMSIDEDADGHLWVELRRLGVVLLAERPTDGQD